MIKQVKIPVQTPLNPMFLLFGSAGGTEAYARKYYASILEDARKGIKAELSPFSVLHFPVMRTMLFDISGPIIVKIYRLSQRTETTLSAAYLMIDLERYHLLKGCYPEDILQLKEAGLTCELPVDPDREGNIIYSNDGDRAVLYAVGENGRDDGGYRDSRKSDEKRDDRIFWERDLNVSSERPNR